MTPTEHITAETADTGAMAEPCAVPADVRADSPRLVIRGETPHDTFPHTDSIAFIDWLGFTVRSVDPNPRWLCPVLEGVFAVPPTAWEDTGRGWFGYLHRINLGDFGLLAFGGRAQRDTVHVELNACACRQVRDWDVVREWGAARDAAVTRADLAHDDFEGRSVDIARVRAWFEAGLFSANGRPPRSELVDDMGSNRGKTLYVGSRESGKMVRIYEKGKQLGDPASAWVRVELELRNKGRVVPWDVVTSPEKYLSGSYPALAFLHAEQSRVRTTQRSVSISYARMVENLRTQGGKAIHVMMTVHGGDAAGVIEKVARAGVPKRLAGFQDMLGSVGYDDGVDSR